MTGRGAPGRAAGANRGLAAEAGCGSLGDVQSLRLRSAELFRFPLRTRLPFKYGIATMVEVPHLFLVVDVEDGGRIARGVAADHLPPKWFTKDPLKPLDEEIGAMEEVIRHAAALALGIRSGTAFGFWLSLRKAQAAWGAWRGHPPLLAQFGTSLVERALLDGLCRGRGTTLEAMVRSNALGVELGAIHPELAGRVPGDYLPAEACPAVLCRHTVGLADPLSEAEISPEERLNDGLPQSLEAGIRRYGLRHFKLKVDGRDPAAARARLGAILAVLRREAPSDFAFSVDGNESFASSAEFREFWQAAISDPALAWAANRVLFVEQPLARSVAFAPAAADFHAWSDRPPIIIDESDAEPDDLRTALALGYSGTSHKNCKGVMKGLAHACLLRHRSRDARRPLLQSGEDLANIGPVALLQDLAVQALLGIRSVERNGHHYFAGLSSWPDAIRNVVAGAHPDLYGPSPAGWPTLRVEDGEISTASVLRAPFGCGFDLPLPTLGEPGEPVLPQGAA